MYYFVQFISLLAFALICYSYTLSDDKKMIKMLSIGALLMSFHFALQEVYATALILLYDVVRNQLAVRIRSIFLALLVCFGYGIIGYITATEKIQYLPVLTGILGTLAYFMLSGINLRLMAIISCSIWFVHDFYYMSTGGMLIDISIVLINIYTIYKLIKTKINNIDIEIPKIEQINPLPSENIIKDI